MVNDAPSPAHPGCEWRHGGFHTNTAATRHTTPPMEVLPEQPRGSQTFPTTQGQDTPTPECRGHMESRSRHT